MNPIESRNRTQHVPSDEWGRQGFLLTAARKLVRDVDAAAVTVFLPSSDAPELRAAVVAVTPLGTGSVERVSVDDDVYPSARAWRTKSVAMAQSLDVVSVHPDLSVFAPFPLQTAAAPISVKARTFGVVTAYWPISRSGITQADIDRLVAEAAGLAADFERLAEQSTSLEPPVVPYVVTAEDDDTAANSLTPHTVPLIYHVHKLAMLLRGAERTSEAIELAMERVMGGFSARAAVISLTDGDRLHVADAAGCSREFLGEADGALLRKSTPETQAVIGQRCAVYAATDRRTHGRLAEQALDEACVWVVLPLLAGGRSVGALSMAFEHRHQDVVARQPTLTALATVLAQAVERTHLHEARHALVEKLQQALLPRMLPQPAGVVSTGRYACATSGIEMGGDWYDLLILPSGGVAMVIGDVEGHNPDAAVVMGQLDSAVRAYANEGHDPGVVLERANDLLIGLDTDLFATCCCVWLDPDTGVAQIASAGHPLPLVHTGEGMMPPPDDLRIGMPLGIDPEARYEVTELTCNPDTIFACFTDGLIRTGSETVSERLAAVVAGDVDIESLGDQIMSDFKRRQAEHADDAALLLVRYEGPSSEAQRTVRQLKIHRRDLQGAQRTRRRLREWLELWHLSDMADEQELLVSEVVTNGLVHGDSDVYVVVRRYPDRVRTEVRDSDPHRAVPVTVPRKEDEAEGGRGLMIVSALASAWGNSPSGRGKTVWFELPVPA